MAPTPDHVQARNQRSPSTPPTSYTVRHVRDSNIEKCGGSRWDFALKINK